jgi:hypothetical protein
MGKNKEAISLREKLTESIMKSKYADDDPQYYQSNENFLNTLTIAELQAMCDDDFEVHEIDEDEDEIQINCPVCGSTHTTEDLDYPLMRNCKACGSEGTSDGDITLNGREGINEEWIDPLDDEFNAHESNFGDES